MDDFDMGRALGAVARLRGGGRVKEVSARTKLGVDGWMDWLVGELAAIRLPHSAAVA
jgi:hypothetical protein